MDPSHSLHQINMGVQSVEDVLGSSKPEQNQKKLRAQAEQALKCPRCDSTNTKFCYYNNYSLSQPRYFCKGCRRYWTQGGSLRNVPVGGGCRKNNKRSSSSSSKKTQDQAIFTTNSNPLPTLPPLTYDSNDLALAFATLQSHKKFTTTAYLGLDEHNETSMLGLGNPSPTTTNNNSIPAFFDAFTESGFNNFCYGFGNDNLGEVENGGEEFLLPNQLNGAATTTTATITTTRRKQEFCKDRDGENRVFCNFTWQVGGQGNNMGSVDSGWNGPGSSWHGLVNGL